jgi:hypothetical protein
MLYEEECDDKCRGKFAVISMSNAYAMANCYMFDDYASAKREYDAQLAKELKEEFAASVALVKMCESFSGRYGWMPTTNCSAYRWKNDC